MKDAVLQIRLPADLLAQYREMCAENLTPASARLRAFIEREVKAWEASKTRRSEPKGMVSAPSPAPVSASPPAPVKSVADKVVDALKEAQRAVGRKLTRKEKLEVERQVRAG